MPDGYARILFIKDLAELDRTILRLQAEADADGAPNQARVIRQAYIELLRDLETISLKYAKRFTTDIQDEQTHTMVRPPAQDPAGDMNSHLESDPLLALPGSVGIVNEKKIDQSPAFWWWTNEIGYSGNEGREINGLFYDAGFQGRGVGATGAMFRDHPLFRPGGPQPDGDGGLTDGGGRLQPTMTIANPIPARHFVRNVIERLEPLWREEIRAAKAKMETRVLTALGEAAGIRAAAAAKRP